MSLLKNIQIAQKENKQYLILCGIKVLRRIIENENKNKEIYDNQSPSYLWEPEEWSLYKEFVIKRQNQLCSIGVIKVICEVVSDPDIKHDIIFEAVILCIALLLGGNKKV